MYKELFKLQNGSDMRGVALEGVPGEDVNLTQADAGCIGFAFANWLGKKVHKNPFELRIIVGNDPRLSADNLKEGLFMGFNMMGAQSFDAGLASTPAMFMSTVWDFYEFDGAVMITASHLPWNRNGFKFFTAEGGLNKEDITEILTMASKYAWIGEWYEATKVDLMPMYSSYLRRIISSGLSPATGGSLKGMKIVVDAGNGAGGFFATEVLEKMGVDITGSQFLEPDGNFPNHAPNPENKDAMASICEAVKREGADLGIIFDTDVDRSAAVTPDGRALARNEIVAIAAALGAEAHPGGTVVTDSITSNELHKFLEEELGLRHLRFKRGYRNVINKAAELRREGEDAFLAIETSGHAAYSDNFYLDDGAFLAVQIVIEAANLKAEGKTIDALIDKLEAPAESVEYRFDITADDFASVGEAVFTALEKLAEDHEAFSLETPNYEGVRVNYSLDDANGWFLLRKSLHDPVLPLNIESDAAGGADSLVQILKEFFDAFDDVDSSIL